MYYLLFSIVWVLAVVVPVGAQQEMRSATKGSSTPLPITGTSADWITSLGHVYTQIQSVTAHPIILAEFGMPDGMNSNTVYGASKVTDGFNAILDTYTQIRGVSLWSNYEAWFMADSFPYDCNIRTGSLQATALQNVIAAHPEKFATCIRTTGNIMQPNCTP